MKHWSVLILTTMVAASLVIGCGGGKLPEEEQQAQSELPDGHPPIGGGQQGGSMSGALGATGPTDDHDLALKLEGMNGVDELNRGKAATDNAAARDLYELGFRKTFAADAAKRDYPGAVADLEEAIALVPDYAEAYRALGYAKFNMGFDVDAAMTNYQKAIELNPDYGEAHYALAFMYAMGDRTQGVQHFKKAMDLGLEDERGLGERFYSGM